MPALDDDVAAAPAGSILDTLRAKRDQLAADRAVTLAAPGLPGVALVLRPLDEGARKRFAARQGKGADAETTGILGLQAACERVLVNGADAGTLHEIAEGILGRDPGGPREELLALWCDPDDPDAVDRTVGLLGRLAEQYGDWLAGAAEDADAALLGN